MAIYQGKVLDGYGKLAGWGIEIGEDGALKRVIPVGEGTEPQGYVIPGLIDIHCHGGGGASFPDSWKLEDVQTAIDAHRCKGTTAMLASLVSMVDPLPQIKLLAQACEQGELIGIHMEGPYVSPHKLGAQNPAAQRCASVDELRTWLEAGKGYIKTMTLAPELDHAQEAAELLLDYGALPSWGHTSATSMQTRERLTTTLEYAAKIKHEGVAQTATHLFNAMPSLHHREPGPIREFVQAARRDEIVVEIIADGVHVNLDLVGDVVNYVLDGSGDDLALVYVSDSMAAAGLEDGAYELGGQPVTVKDGVARLTGGDNNIAGGTSRLVEQIQRTARAGVVPIEKSVRACVAAPARVLGLSNADAGVSLTFEPGEKPNAIVLDSNLDVQAVIREGGVL